MVEPEGYLEESRELIAACIEVHRHLGPGLLEAIYERCLARELEIRRIAFRRQEPIPVSYKGTNVGVSYRSDIIVGGTMIVEIKAVDALLPLHEAQLQSYLRLANIPIGFLINFNVFRLKQGIRRITRRPLPP